MMGAFRSLFASLENPKEPITSCDEGGGYQSTSGLIVNPRRGLTLSAVWRAGNLIADSVAKLDLNVMKQDERNNFPDVDHPAFRLLRWKPNSMCTAFTWKRVLMHHVLMRGNGYSYIVRDRSAQPVELLNLDPDATHPVVVVENHGEPGERRELWYKTTITFPGSVQATHMRIPASDMIHVMGKSNDGFVGYDLFRYANEALGVAAATQKYGAIFFRNSSRPPTVLLYPGNLDQAKRDEIRAAWERMQSGIDNAHRTAVLTQGMEVKELGTNARNAQLIEQKKLSIVDVSNYWGAPTHKIGGDARTSYASLEQENLSFLADDIDPWLIQIEYEARDKMLTEEEKENYSHTVEFDRLGLIRADMNSRASYYASGIMNGWMNRDQAARREGLPALPDDEGQKYFIPKAMDVVGEPDESEEPLPEPTSPEPPEPGLDNEAIKQTAERTKNVLRAQVARMVRRVRAEAYNAANDAQHYVQFCEGWEGRHGTAIRDALDPLEGILRNLAGQAPSGAVSELVINGIDAELQAGQEKSLGKLRPHLETTFMDFENTLPQRAVDLLSQEDGGKKEEKTTIIHNHINIENHIPQQEPPVVHNHIPEQPPPVVNTDVHVPQQPAPIVENHNHNDVEVNVPEQAPPTINNKVDVHVPPVDFPEVIKFKRDTRGRIEEGRVED